jgi:hypothetical protein
MPVGAREALWVELEERSKRIVGSNEAIVGALQAIAAAIQERHGRD